jgi:hypothetical protein
MAGKTIKIYLPNGTPNGILIAEITNWTGKVIVAPHTQLAELAKRSEVMKTGVYVLSGQDPDNPLRDRVYIGEGDNVWVRLREHDKSDKRDFWTRTLVIMDTSDNLTKAHVRYLESRLIQVANDANRATLDNDTAPPRPHLPEPDIAAMESFLDEITVLLPVLGFSFALPVPTQRIEKEIISKVASVDASPLFYIKASGASAEAREINGEFIVLKGAMVRRSSKPSLKKTPSELRNQLRKDGKLVDVPDTDLWVLTEDVPFPSPSAAAAVIVGYTINGRYEWKVKATGQAYGEWQQARIEQAGIISPKPKK